MEKEILKLNEQNLTVQQICNKLSLCKPTVYKVLRKFNIKPNISYEYFDVDKINKALNTCKTIKEVAENLNYKYDNLKRFCRINKIKPKKDENIIQKVLELHKKGLSVVNISENLDIGYNKIYNILKCNNLQPNLSNVYHDYNEIQNMLNDEMTIDKIAEEVEASKKHLYEQLKNKNISINRFYSFDKINKIKAIPFKKYEEKSKLRYKKYIKTLPIHIGNNKISNSFTMSVMNKYKAYFLGVVYGDGCLYKSGYCVDIGMQDLDVLQIINKNLFHGNCNISKRDNYYRLAMYSRKLWNELNILFSLTNNKSAIIKYPKLNNNFLPHFIRGLLDSDGCFSTKASKKRVLSFTYTTCSKDFINSLYNALMKELNFKRVRIRERIQENSKPCYQVIWSNKIDAKNLGYYIYKDSFGNRGERKFNIWKTYINKLGEK